MSLYTLMWNVPTTCSENFEQGYPFHRFYPQTRSCWKAAVLGEDYILKTCNWNFYSYEAGIILVLINSCKNTLQQIIDSLLQPDARVFLRKIVWEGTAAVANVWMLEYSNVTRLYYSFTH